MMRVLGFPFSLLTTTHRTRASLQAEIVVLRHRLAVYQRRGQRLRIAPADRLLLQYFACYHEWRLHRSLGMDAPDSRSERPTKPEQVVEFAPIQGLHHYNLPQAA